MCKKNPSSKSDSPHKQPQLTPPSTTTVDQPSHPPRLSLEPVDPEIIHAIVQAVAPLNAGEHEKALNFIKDSISSHPRPSGQLHYTEGRVHWSLAKKAAGDDDVAKVKHLEDGVRAALLAVKLLPKSLHCARLLVDLLYDLAFFNKEWEKVEEACDQGLAIENSIDFGIGDLFDDDLYNQSRFEEAIKWLKKVEIPDNLEADKDGEVDINHLVMALDRRKKQIMKKLKENHEDILKYKSFWNITLSDETKRGFRKVNIEELDSHFKSLKNQLAVVELLREAIAFAKQHKTWKFWECCACVKKFVDYKLFEKHFWEVHWMGCRSYWILGEEYMKESVDLVTNGVWKPVDTNPMKSKNNDSSKGPKWAFCDDDIVRLLILGKIRSTFALLHKNKCLAPINIRWAIEYTENQFESMYPLSQYLNLGAKSLQIIRLLRASQLTEVQAFLEVVARAGRLSENVETDNYIDDEISDHHLFDIKERVLFSRDFTCLVLDERVLRGELNVTNYFDAVAGDHSSADECGDDVVIPASDDIVSWLYMDSNCREVLRSWTSLREARRRQAKKSHGVQLKKLSVLPKVCAKIEENPGKLVAVQIIEHMFFEETKRREESPEYEPELYIDLLKKREKKLQEMNKSFVKSEIAVISEVLKQVEEVQYGFEGSNKQEHTKRIDYCVGKALRRLKLKLIKDLTIHDTVILRRLALFNQYKLELTNISVCDYRSIVVPILKEFLQSHLKDLYEDAEKKSEAAEKALLADIANEEADKESKDVKQNQDKKKKKKKKNKKKNNKNPETSKESEQCDSKNGDSLDEPKQSTAADEAQMLDEYLENQRRFEEEDDDQGQWILIKKKKKKYKSQESFEKKINKDSANVKQKQYEKKKKKNTNPKKDKESEGTNDSKQFDLHQKGAEQDDTTNSKSNDSLGELKQLTVSDEERMLAKYLENQRQFERQASVKVNVSGNRLEKLLGDSVSVDVSENSSAIEESMLKEPSEYQRQIDNNEAKQKCIVEKSKNIGETIGRNAVEGVSDFSPERLLGDSVSVGVSENSSAIEERMLEEPSEYQRQIDDDEAKQKCIAEKPKNIGETIGGNAEEGVSDYSLESNHEEYEKRFLRDIEKAICLSLDCFEKRYGTLLPTDVNNGKTSRLDVQLYVIMQSQWYLRQIRDEFMSIVPNKTHTHAGDPCFRCAYSDTFAARRIASRYVPEEVVQLSSRIFYPVQDYFVEWLTEQNPANKVIGISSSACQLKQQLVDVVRKIVLDLENERQINNDDTEKDFAEQNTA